jgi:hypothetical protein
MRRRFLDEAGGELAAGVVNGPGRGDLAEDLSGLSCGDVLGGPAGDELAEHGVQPAGDLRPGPAQVAVALGPHLKDCCVVVGCDFSPGG